MLGLNRQTERESFDFLGQTSRGPARKETYCHQCCMLVKCRHAFICPYCHTHCIESVPDSSKLQRVNQVYTPPPNVVEQRRPLIIVGHQIVTSSDLEQRQKINTVNISNLDKREATSSLTNETQCSICLGPFKFSDKIPITSDEEPDEVSKLLCGHVFHYKCAKKWFSNTNRNECPFCRQ